MDSFAEPTIEPTAFPTEKLLSRFDAPVIAEPVRAEFWNIDCDCITGAFFETSGLASFSSMASPF